MKIDRYLLDTNILLRLTDQADTDHATTMAAVRKLVATGALLHTCSQNMIEYRVVSTRPVQNNGFGFTSADAAKDIAKYDRMFPVLLDSTTPIDVYPIWRRLVEGAGTVGKPNHDARILAVAEAHGCTHLLTFNPRDFVRYASLSPGIAIVNPHDV